MARTTATRRLSIQKLANSLLFSTTSSQTTMGNNFGPERTSPFSYSMWVLVTGAPSTTNRYLFSKGSDNLIGIGLFIGSIANGSAFEFSLTNTDNTNRLRVRNTVAVDRLGWQHVVVTYDGSSTAAGTFMYINGVVQTLTVVNNTLSATIINALSFRLGQDEAGGNAQKFQGNMCNFRIHSVALSQAQVTELYYDDTATSVTAQWTMSGNGGTTLTGAVGGVNGTITTPIWSGSNPIKRRVATRNLTNSLSGVGTGSNVSLGNNFSKERTDSFSVSGWFFLRKFAAQGLWSKYDDNILARGFMLTTDAAANLDFYLINTVTTNQIRVSVTVGRRLYFAQQWYHIVVTYDGSSTAAGVKIYLNGVSAAFSTLTDNLSATIVNSTDFDIGDYNNTIGVDGRYTDFAIHNATLTASEVEDLYYERIQTQVQGAWDFRDGAGTTLTAQVGGINGTIDLGATWNTEVPLKLRTTATARTDA